MLKTKTTLKVAIGTFVMAVAFIATSAMAYDFGTVTLRVGSKGEAVKTLQTLVGATADGNFGPMTAAKVKAWQANNGLTADGVFGPMSMAKANAVAGPVQGACPAGYVATTPVAPLFASCVVATPAQGNCPTGYVAVTPVAPTFASCAVSTATPVTGGAGDIIVSNTSTDVESTVSEGEKDIKILGFRVEADGSDVNLTNVKVSLQTTGVTSSTRIERYMSDVSVWMGSTKVGSADVADFNKDGTLYTKNIALTGATIKEGAKPYFYVAVSAIPNIDGADLDSEVFTIDAMDVRFVDGTGMVLTDTTNITATSPDFISLSTSGEVKLNITKGAAPVAGNVKVSDTTSTADVLMNQFKLKATGSDMTLSKIVLTTTGTGAQADESASEISIKVGGSVIATNDAVLPAATAATAVNFTLDDDLVIKAGETVTFDVFAKINKVGTATFAQGEALKVDYTSVVIEDKNGDAVTSISGSALGEVQTFYSEGVNASNFTSTVTATTDTGVTKKQTYALSFNLTAFGNTYYIPKTTVRDTATAAQELVYVIEKTDGITAATVAEVPSTASGLSSTASTEGAFYVLADGETKTFSLTVEATDAGTTAGYYRVQLGSVAYDLNTTPGGASYYTFAPAQNFETADKKID